MVGSREKWRGADDTVNDSVESLGEIGTVLQLPALVLAWSRDEPDRVGEVVLIEPHSQAWVLGRETDDNRAEPGRLGFVRQRPGRNHATGQLRSPRVSRRHLELRARSSNRLAVRNSSPRPMRVNGVEASEAELGPGDVLELHNTALLWCTTRSHHLPTRPELGLELHDFGGPDVGGIIGESPLIWNIREQIAFAARRPAHVLIRGPSGSGKELAASMIHALSQRADKPFVARNAATLPAGLIDAELFGNAKNYPNPGMSERPGLIGSAAGGTLFLDEIGELSHELQAHLLRLLDHGEYQRLGESQTRRADLRLVGATNRDADELKHDLLARMPIRIELPGLDRRREDIPLLALHLLRRIATADADIAARFFVGRDAAGWPRMSVRLIYELLKRPYTTHVRELEQQLYAGMLGSQSNVIEFIAAPEENEPEPEFDTTPPDDNSTDPTSLTSEQIIESLERNGGSQAKTWRELGLRSRYQLIRLMRKHGIAARSE
jgi:DNA-binding NtrC family response regulator